MSKIENSPLIEAMFELRWGEKQPGNFKFNRDEMDLLPGVFSQAIKQTGYGVTERLPKVPDIPAIPKYRFRKAPNKWPCLQLGLGIFTINQIGAASISAEDNDDYDWDDFKLVIEEGLTVFDDSYPSGLNDLISPTAILRYQDGFILGKNESLEEFIHHKINADASLTPRFLDHTSIAKEATDIKMEFTFNTAKPKGNISISLVSAQIKGERGMVFETRVISKLKDEEKSVGSLVEWAENAHTLHRHSFDTLICNR